MGISLSYDSSLGGTILFIGCQELLSGFLEGISVHCLPWLELVLS